MLLLYDLAISSYGCKTRILLRHKALNGLPRPMAIAIAKLCHQARFGLGA